MGKPRTLAEKVARTYPYMRQNGRAEDMAARIVESRNKRTTNAHRAETLFGTGQPAGAAPTPSAAPTTPRTDANLEKTLFGTEQPAAQPAAPITPQTTTANPGAQGSDADLGERLFGSRAPATRSTTVEAWRRPTPYERMKKLAERLFSGASK